MFNIPMILTFLRVGLIPFVVIIYYIPTPWAHFVSALLFIIAALTDWLDGYVARQWNQITKFGAFLDPVADKLLVAAALVALVDHLNIFMLAIPAIVIIAREILVSALREWMAEIGKRARVNVVKIAKYKTVLQMVGIAVLLWYHPVMNHLFLWLGIIIIYIAATLTVWSMFVYLKLAWPDLTSTKE